MSSKLASLLALAVPLAAGAWSPAAAQPPETGTVCFKDIGCTGPGQPPFNRQALMPLGCQLLADIRNRMLYEQGYCFTDPYYRQLFANPDCTPDRRAVYRQVERTEWVNIILIREVEQIKGCTN